MTVSELAGCAAAFLGFAALWIRRERRDDWRRDFRRTGLDNTLLAVIMAGAAWGQGSTLSHVPAQGAWAEQFSGPVWQPPNSGSLCGTTISTPDTQLVAIACPDFDALAKLGVPGVYGQRLQVLVKAKYGWAVRVRAYYVDAEGKEAYVTEYGDINQNPDGSLGAMIQFFGWQYTRIEVKVAREW